MERYRAEQRYMPFFGTVTERAFQKKFQNTRAYTNDATLRFGYFPRNALGDGPAFWIFFQYSRIRVKDTEPWLKLFQGPSFMDKIKLKFSKSKN